MQQPRKEFFKFTNTSQYVSREHQIAITTIHAGNHRSQPDVLYQLSRWVYKYNNRTGYHDGSTAQPDPFENTIEWGQDIDWLID